jgi:hypothetical protein
MTIEDRLTFSERKDALCIHVISGSLASISDSSLRVNGVKRGEIMPEPDCRALSPEASDPFFLFSIRQRLLCRSKAVVSVASSVQSSSPSQHRGRASALGCIFPPNQSKVKSNSDEAALIVFIVEVGDGSFSMAADPGSDDLWPILQQNQFSMDRV